MDNKDVLRRLCVRLDYPTLIKFGGNSRWIVQVTELMDDPVFWKEKTEYVVGQTLSSEDRDWITVYHAMVKWKKGDYDYNYLAHKDDENEDSGIFSHIYVLGMDDLDVMRTIVEVQPPTRLTIENARMYREDMIRSAEVLDWLLTNHYIEYDNEQYLIQYYTSAGNNDVDILKYIEAHTTVDPKTSRKAIMEAAVEGANDVIEYLHGRGRRLTPLQAIKTVPRTIDQGHYITASILLNMYNEKLTQASIRDMILAVLGTRGSLSILHELLMYVDKNTSDWLRDTYKLLERVIIYDKGEQLQLLLEEGDIRLDSHRTKGLIYDAIINGSYGAIRELINLPLLESDLYNVVLAGSITQSKFIGERYVNGSSTPMIFELLLSHPSLDVMKIIDRLVADMSQDRILVARFSHEQGAKKRAMKVEDMMFTLVRNDRVDVARLSIGTLRSIISSLERTMSDKVEGYIAANALVGRVTDKQELMNFIEGNSLQALLLRFILLKQPTALELTAWMKQKKDRQLVQAAANVVQDSIGSDPILVPIEGLMLAILYPTRSIQALLSDLQEENARQGGAFSTEGVAQLFLQQAASLVGAFRGARAMQATN